MFCEIPNLGRCCFCMPLRRGVLTFGYLNVIFSIFMIVVYSLSMKANIDVILLYHGAMSEVDSVVCLIFYSLDIVFNLAMVYGAHRRILICLKVYYHYAILTTVLMFVMQVIGTVKSESCFFIGFEFIALFFVGFCIHVYLIILMRSLIRKLEISDNNNYENQLHNIVNGDVKIEANGVYPSTVIPNDTV